MTKRELEELNTELIELLIAMRDQIEEKLAELSAVEEDEETLEGDEFEDDTELPEDED